jgi:hypothetical protein
VADLAAAAAAPPPADGAAAAGAGAEAAPAPAAPAAAASFSSLFSLLPSPPVAGAGDARDTLTLCAATSAERREWIVHIKSRLRAREFPAALNRVYLHPAPAFHAQLTRHAADA